MRVRALTVALALTALLAASPAPADELPPAALTLTVELRGSKLSAEAIRSAVELELGRPVALAPASDHAGLLVVAHANRTVTVSFRTTNGVTRSRTIGIPQDNARSAEVIALLSGNLSRDEAAELLASLAAKTPPPATTTAPPAPDAPTAAPEPKPEPKLEAKPEAKAGKPEAKAEAKTVPPALKPTPLNASLVAPLTLFPNTRQRRIHFELGLFYSHVGELRGAGVNAIALNNEGDTHGVSIASLYNRSGGTVHGLGLSGLVQQSGGLEGAQLAGLLNLGSGHAQGLSAAGALDWQQDFTGLQLAGALNRARRIEGVQAAGAVNIAQRVSGLQLGVVNVADEVNGLQLGVVNVAKHVKGTSIGVVSVADNGRVQPVLFASTNSPLNGAVKFTIGPLYTQVGFGDGPGAHTWQYELGVGAHLAFGRWFVEPGVHYSEVRDTRNFFGNQLIEYGHYRVAVGVDLGKVTPFVGGGVLQRFHHGETAPASVPTTAEGFAGVAFF